MNIDIDSAINLLMETKRNHGDSDITISALIELLKKLKYKQEQKATNKKEVV